MSDLSCANNMCAYNVGSTCMKTEVDSAFRVAGCQEKLCYEHNKEKIEKLMNAVNQGIELAEEYNSILNEFNKLTTEDDFMDFQTIGEFYESVKKTGMNYKKETNEK